MKMCPVCKGEKDFSEFHRDSHAYDGYASACKLCTRARNKISRAKLVATRTIAVSGTKICNACRLEKGVAEFFVDKGLADGRDGTCKKCKKKRKLSRANTEPIASRKKNCSKCLELLPVDEFYKNSVSKNGYTAQCKRCITKRQSIWRSKNKQRVARYGKNRKVKLLNTGSFRESDWQLIISHYCPSGVCLKCMKNVGKERLTRDHVIPVDLYGPNFIWNLQPLCFLCNVRRPRWAVQDFRPDGGRFAMSIHIRNIKTGT